MSSLIAVAHGSRDPRSARTVAAVVDRIRLRRPDLDVHSAFLDLTDPSVESVVDRVVADGADSAVVVPLLLGSAFHAKIDLPGLLAAARVRHPDFGIVQADVLGHDERLIDALRSRIVDTGAHVDDPRVGVALGAVGSSDAAANRVTSALADRVRAGTAWKAAPCFATNRDPRPADAVAKLTAAGATEIVVAPWFLAPGLLTDRLFTAFAELTDSASGAGVSCAGVLGSHPLVAEVVSDRYDAAVTLAADGGRMLSALL